MGGSAFLMNKLYNTTTLKSRSNWPCDNFCFRRLRRIRSSSSRNPSHITLTLKQSQLRSHSHLTFFPVKRSRGALNLVFLGCPRPELGSFIITGPVGITNSPVNPDGNNYWKCSKSLATPLKPFHQQVAGSFLCAKSSHESNAARCHA